MIRNSKDKAKLYQQKKILLKKRRIQLIKLVICLLLVLGISVTGTIAFIVTHTNSITNTFKESNVACQVEETFNNNVKSDVSIKNTGDSQAYIRAYVNITWFDQTGNKVHSCKPIENTDYKITYSDDGWLLGSDGYWYYKLAVDAGDSTEVLISKCELLSTANAPEGYSLSVEIVCSAIQSSPTSVVTDMWNVQVDSDGKITGIGG